MILIPCECTMYVSGLVKIPPQITYHISPSCGNTSPMQICNSVIVACFLFLLHAFSPSFPIGKSEAVGKITGVSFDSDLATNTVSHWYWIPIRKKSEILEDYSDNNCTQFRSHVAAFHSRQ